MRIILTYLAFFEFPDPLKSVVGHDGLGKYVQVQTTREYIEGSLDVFLVGSEFFENLDPEDFEVIEEDFREAAAISLEKEPTHLFLVNLEVE